MDVCVNNGIWSTMFGVPNIVADNFLKLASESQIKSLLYILRNNGRMISSEEISRALGIPLDEADECIIFWQQANVLSNQSETTMQSQLLHINSSNNQLSNNKIPDASISEKKANIDTSSSSLKLTPAEVADILTRSDDVKGLFTMAESQLGTLNHTMQRSLIWLHDYVGLKSDVLITLIAYCVSIGKTNIGYIEKIGASWGEIGINTLELAENEINRMTRSDGFVSQIVRTFEMKRKPTPNQMDFINEWQKSGYSIDIVKFAYERTIERKDKLDFAYINGILKNWNNKGFKTTDEVKQAELEYKNKNLCKNENADDQNSTSNVDKYKSLINNF